MSICGSCRSGIGQRCFFRAARWFGRRCRGFCSFFGLSSPELSLGTEMLCRVLLVLPVRITYSSRSEFAQPRVWSIPSVKKSVGTYFSSSSSVNRACGEAPLLCQVSKTKSSRSHGAAAFIAFNCDSVNPWLMQLEVCWNRFLGCFDEFFFACD